MDWSQLFEIICMFPAIYTVRGWMSTSSTTSIKNKREELKNFEHLILFLVFATVIPIVLPVYFERLVICFYVSYNSMSLNSRSCLVTIVLHLLLFFGNSLVLQHRGRCLM